MTALTLLLALAVGGLLVAVGLVGGAWSRRRAEARGLASRIEVVEGRNAQLRADLDRAAADHADALRELGHVGEDLARERQLTRRSIERERPWSDLINPGVPVDRAGKYVPTPREAAEWADLDRRLEES